MRAMLASTIQKSNNQDQQPAPATRAGPVLMSQNPNSVLETRPPPAPEGSTPTPPTAGTGSTTQTRTKGPSVRRRLHYPNTTNNPAEHSPAAASHKRGVCAP
jgi:hypothetical protein